MTNELNVQNKTVLVTGGCGFIGINLVIELLQRGAVVSVLDLPTADWSKVPLQARCEKADLLNKKSLIGAFDGIEIIYHLAAKTDLDGKSKEAYGVNYEGTKNIIETASKEKTVKRFIYFSSQLVVGLFDETRFIDEYEPYRTKTFYGQSKIEGEKVVAEYCPKFSIPYTIIRPTSVYGPWGGTPYREFFQLIKQGRYFHIGKANNLVSWVYVKNLVEFTVIASLNTKAESEIYFCNDFHPYTMKEIVDEVASYYAKKISTVPNLLATIVAYTFGVLKLMGIKVPLYPSRLSNIRANYCFDVHKSVGIGYDPKYNLKKGIKETLEWYENNQQKYQP